jgi:hypothetical protein
MLTIELTNPEWAQASAWPLQREGFTLRPLTMTAFLLLAVPALGQQQIYINRPGQAPIVGQMEESGNVLLFDLEKNQPVYWGQRQGNQINLYPMEGQSVAPTPKPRFGLNP